MALAQTASTTKAPVVLIVGDSLSAEYGLRRGSGWVALLQAEIDRQGPLARVVNASISGDTTSGGRSRLPALLRQHQPTVVVIELGGNDGLRGYPISKIQANLGNMIALCQEQGIEILLIGMVLPPNYGRRYTEAFVGIYSTLAAEFNLAGFLPHLLSGIATDPNLLQRDGIHPTVAAQPLIKEQIKPLILNWLTSN